MTMHTASADLPGVLGSPRLARSFISQTLTEWHCDHVVDAATLLVSELATNAVLHARTDMTVATTLDDHKLRVEVWDHNPLAPFVRAHQPQDLTGRGMAMVEGFASAWGAEVRQDGKCVWFEMDV
jgi:anti-sigma regulatory factor (Ser/Thr protein kinase)